MTEPRSNAISRRELLRQALAAGVSLPFAKALWSQGLPQAPAGQIPQPAEFTLSPEDDQFLDELERASFQFFWEQQNPKTGMVQDRCDIRGGTPGVVASIAATGFGLTALCIGEKRGFISRTEALERLFPALNFFWKKLPNHRGFFYHWANINTGERVWESEISSVDTALLLCGVLTCRQHFKHPAVVQLADLIFNRSNGLGFPKIPPFCPTDGLRRSVFFPRAGITTAS